jgi:hypothetical protein
MMVKILPTNYSKKTVNFHILSSKSANSYCLWLLDNRNVGDAYRIFADSLK